MAALPRTSTGKIRRSEVRRQLMNFAGTEGS
jgi:acyl-coenzyme A synthetase/AMP-(fatty) acid ligase